MHQPSTSPFALCLLAGFILSGCTSMLDTKTSDFGCAGMPQGVKCLSARDVYSATESSDYVNGEIAQQWQEKQNKKAGPAIAEKPIVIMVPEVTPAADKPRPIRHPAQVMRVWVNSFEDEEGDLYAGQYVYTEIEPRRWTLGTERVDGKGGMSPLSSSGRNSLRETASPLDAPKKK
jgi:conjugal transfer pilus assembly protein TraV